MRQPAFAWATAVAISFANATAQDAAPPAQDALTPAAQRAAYRAIDFGKLDRRIAKEPSYVAEPRYALFVFDLAGEHRVWAVADKSTQDAPHYDVLYLDLDGDGDLTDAGERFTGTYDEKLAPAGMGLTIRVGDIRVPGTALVHTKFLVSTTPKAGRDGFWFRMHWNGTHEMSGGYGEKGTSTTVWQDSPAKAPVLRPCPFGPLSFATWGDEKLELRAGTTPKINVIAGNRGHGTGTLTVVDENFLDLQSDELLVTVVAKDKDGAEVTETSRFRHHC